MDIIDYGFICLRVKRKTNLLAQVLVKDWIHVCYAGTYYNYDAQVVHL